MTPDMLERLQLLARLLFDARLTASSVVMQAEYDGLDQRDYDVRADLGALCERVRILMERAEEK